MNQTEYSKLCETFLKEQYPSFLNSLSRKEDGSFDCSIKSKLGKVHLWISTYDLELTIGFENSEGKCSWHCHKNSSPEESPNKELTELRFLIDSILNDKEKIILDEELGFIILDEDELTENDKEIYCWSTL